MTTYTKEELASVNLRSGRFDMTQIPRLRTDFTAADGIPNWQALNALNAQCNEQSERVEDLWIELDCQLIDRMEAEAERKRKGLRKTPQKTLPSDLFDDCPSDLLNEIKTDLGML